MSKKIYSDEEFVNEVVSALRATGKTVFTPAKVKQALIFNPKIDQLYPNLSWNQGGRYNGRLIWKMTDFSDRIVRNLKQVAKRYPGLVAREKFSHIANVGYRNKPVSIYKTYFELI